MPVILSVCDIDQSDSGTEWEKQRVYQTEYQYLMGKNNEVHRDEEITKICAKEGRGLEQQVAKDKRNLLK